jgi:hypothetical protein
MERRARSLARSPREFPWIVAQYATVRTGSVNVSTCPVDETYWWALYTFITFWSSDLNRYYVPAPGNGEYDATIPVYAPED